MLTGGTDICRSESRRRAEGDGCEDEEPGRTDKEMGEGVVSFANVGSKEPELDKCRAGMADGLVGVA